MLAYICSKIRMNAWRKAILGPVSIVFYLLILLKTANNMLSNPIPGHRRCITQRSPWHWADLAKCECIVGGCTGPAEVRPPLCASVQSALGLRAPRSRSPPYHLPTPPGSPAVWWTLASLMETAQRDISLEILLLLHFFRALLFYILNIWLSPVCESWRGSNKLSCRSTTKHFTNNRPRLEEK